MPYAPKSKRAFYELFDRGVTGNKGLNWLSVEEAVASGYSGLMAIRTKGVGTRCDYNIPACDIITKYHSFLADGFTPEQLNFSAMMPDEKIVLQGEVMRTARVGLALRYSRAKHGMRAAFKEDERRATGLAAKLLIQQAMDAESWDWLNYLLDYYVIDHEHSGIVEFSCYSIPVGHLQWNTVIWEIRGY